MQAATASVVTRDDAITNAVVRPKKNVLLKSKLTKGAKMGSKRDSHFDDYALMMGAFSLAGSRAGTRQTAS